jgi:hypothetical protein
VPQLHFKHIIDKKKNIPRDVAVALICKPIASDLRTLSKVNYPTKKKQHHNGYNNYIDP